METKANHVLIGAFTIAVTVFLLLFALWAAQYSSDRSWLDHRVALLEPVPEHAHGRTGGSPDAPPLVAGPDGEPPVIETAASALQNIADTANRLVERLDQVLSEENVARISATLDNIESMTGAIAGQREDMREILVNA